MTGHIILPGTRPRPEPSRAAQAVPARVVTARVDGTDAHDASGGAGVVKVPPLAGLVKDWDLPGLPADCAPGRASELLTDAQARARITATPTDGPSAA